MGLGVAYYKYFTPDGVKPASCQSLARSSQSLERQNQSLSHSVAIGRTKERDRLNGARVTMRLAGRTEFDRCQSMTCALQRSPAQSKNYGSLNR
jgi:hypothetical protein